MNEGFRVITAQEIFYPFTPNILSFQISVMTLSCVFWLGKKQFCWPRFSAFSSLYSIWMQCKPWFLSAYPTVHKYL